MKVEMEIESSKTKSEESTQPKEVKTVPEGKLLLTKQTADPHRVKWKILNSPNETQVKRLAELEKLVQHREDRDRFSGFVELGGLVTLANWLRDAVDNSQIDTITRILRCLNYDTLDLTLNDLETSTLGQQVLSLQSLPYEQTRILVHELSERWKRMINTPQIKKPKSTKKKSVKFADEKQKQLRMMNRFAIEETIVELHARLAKSRRLAEEDIPWATPKAWDQSSWDPKVIESIKNFSSSSEEKSNHSKWIEHIPQEYTDTVRTSDPADKSAEYTIFCKELEMESAETEDLQPIQTIATPVIPQVHTGVNSLVDAITNATVQNIPEPSPPSHPHLPEKGSYSKLIPIKHEALPPRNKPRSPMNLMKKNASSDFASRKSRRRRDGFRTRGKGSFRERERHFRENHRIRSGSRPSSDRYFNNSSPRKHSYPPPGRRCHREDRPRDRHRSRSRSWERRPHKEPRRTSKTVFL